MWRGMSWRALGFGVVGGVLLSLARPPAGITLEEWMAPSGARVGLWRMGALTVIALALYGQPAPRAGARSPLPGWLCGAALGFALHGLAGIDVLGLHSQTAWLAALVAGFGLLWTLRERRADDPVSATPAEQGASPVALFLCGAGVTIAAEALRSRLCLFGGGTRDDETVFGCVALLSLVLGSLAFGPLVQAWRHRPLLSPLLLVLAATLAGFGLGFLESASLPRAYDALLGRFGLSSEDRGTLLYDGLFAARTQGLSFLCVGVALSCARGAAALGHVLLGAGLAALWIPNGSPFGGEDVGSALRLASQRADLGALTAAAGAAWAGLRWKLPLTGRLACLAVPAACALFVARQSPWTIHSPSPWERVMPQILWARDTPEGLLTVELQAGRGRVATLDRRLLTPTLDESPAEELRWRNALSEPRERDCVVVAGLPTLERATLLQVFGVTHAWFVAPWSAELLGKLKSALFDDAPWPQGATFLFDHTWGASEDSGAPGVIVCPPVEAPAYSSACLAPRAAADRPGLRVLGWLPAREDIAALPWGERVRASCSHLEDLTIGIDTAGTGPQLAAGARSWGGPLARLRLTRFEREKAARVQTAARLVRGEASATARALLLLCEAQAASSPFESRAVGTELDPRALELLRQSALGREPAGFERELVEFVAAVLEAKRDLDGLGSFAEPIADAHPSWPALQRAATRGDWEFLRYREAAERLARVAGATPYDLQARLWLAEAWLRAAEPARALAEVEALLEIQSGRGDFLRLRALAAVRAGDPRGPSWLGAWIQAHPEDAEAARHGSTGPYGPLDPPVGVPGEVGEH